MEKKVLKEIFEFIFGRKYYVNIIHTKGTSKYEACSFIFRTKDEAEEHKYKIGTTLSFQFIETISFRSYKEYGEDLKDKLHS